MSYHKNLTQSLVDEILEVVYRYEETMLVPTVLGCLDLVKQQIIQEHIQEDEE